MPLFLPVQNFGFPMQRFIFKFNIVFIAPAYRMGAI